MLGEEARLLSSTAKSYSAMANKVPVVQANLQTDPQVEQKTIYTSLPFINDVLNIMVHKPPLFLIKRR